MKKRFRILSAVVLVLSFILAAAVGCGRQKNNPASYEREATESDRTYFRSHAVYNGSFKSELTEDELIFYNAYEKHILEERSLEPIEIDVSQMKFLSRRHIQRSGKIFPDFPYSRRQRKVQILGRQRQIRTQCRRMGGFHAEIRRHCH